MYEAGGDDKLQFFLGGHETTFSLLVPPPTPDGGSNSGLNASMFTLDKSLISYFLKSKAAFFADAFTPPLSGEILKSLGL
jgi:hypothetical protein